MSTKHRDNYSGNSAVRWLQLLRHLLAHTRVGFALTLFFGSIFIGLILLIVQYEARHAKKPTELGVSFSVKYANELGINWQDAYRDVIEDLGFRKLRLMSYWDMHEPINNEYDFSALDWQFDIAEENGARIDLALGERQPRWPECHPPTWARELSTEERIDELLEFIAIVVNRYKDSPALEQYQLENEYFLPTFGECDEASRERLVAEKELVKSIDPSKPVIINVSNQNGVPVRSPVGDKVGFSMYRKAHGKLFGADYYWDFWYAPPYWHTMRAALIELFHGQETGTFVHELQTEPWGPGPTSQLSIEVQNQTMDAAKIGSQVRYAEATGMSEIYMWGAEWWYWRKTYFSDPSLWNAVNTLLDERPASRSTMHEAPNYTQAN